MSKKRIIAIVASLLIVLGISYGAYASVTKNQASTHTTRVAKQKSHQDAQPKEIGLKGQAKAKKTHKTQQATKKADAAKKASEKKADASSQASQKAAEQASTSAATAKQQAAAQSAVSQSVSAATSQTAAAPENTTKQATPQPATNNQQSTSNAASQQPVAKNVTISIYGPITEGNRLLVNHDSVAINDGDKVIDVLKRDTAGHGMALSYKGAGSTVYVKGINGLFEFDKGSQSGWLYRVNGVFPNYSCGSYTVKSGDVIDWMYTEDLGHDRNAPQG